MKKFLSILAAVGLTATASTSVVACTAKTITKDIVMKATDLENKTDQIDYEVRSAYNYVKINNDIATEIGNKHKANSKETEKTVNKETFTPLILDKDEQNKAEGILLEVVSYTPKGGKTKYQFASGNNFLPDIATAKTGSLEFSFVKVVDLLNILNDKTLNSYSETDKNNKDVSKPIVSRNDYTTDKNDDDTFQLSDLVEVDKLKKDGTFHGDWTDMVGQIAGPLTDNDYGQELLAKVFPVGVQKVILNITVGDTSTPTQWDPKTVAKYVD